MPLVFQSRPGQVVKLDDPALSCNVSFFSLSPTISFDSEKSIITRITMSQQVNMQFLHSFGSLIHIYVFGDRMGSINLSGLSFACDCPSGSEFGAEKIMAWYSRNRASKRAEPCRLTIGKRAVEGFANVLNEDVVDPSLNMVQWSISFASLPEDD